MTEAIKDCYRRLIFAYKEVVSRNPKKPGIIPGIFHQIIWDKPTEQVMPWREPYRRGSPSEEELKESEVKIMIDNDIAVTILQCHCASKEEGWVSKNVCGHEESKPSHKV